MMRRNAPFKRVQMMHFAAPPEERQNAAIAAKSKESIDPKARAERETATTKERRNMQV